MAFLDNNGLLYLLQKLDARYMTEAETDQKANYAADNTITRQLNTAQSPLGMALAQKASSADLALKADSASLATVATSGSFNDLADKPTIPTMPAVGVAGGVASLDSNGKVPASQLPSFVDDVIECTVYDENQLMGANWLADTNGNLIVPESGKIYVLLSDGTQYRWGGTAYVALQSSSGVSALTNTEIETLWVGQFGSIVFSQISSPSADFSSVVGSYANVLYFQLVNTTDGPGGAGMTVQTGTTLNISESQNAFSMNGQVQLGGPLMLMDGSIGQFRLDGGFGPGTYELAFAWNEATVEPDPGNTDDPTEPVPSENPEGDPVEKPEAGSETDSGVQP